MIRRRAWSMRTVPAVIRARAAWALTIVATCWTALGYGCGQMSAGTCADTATCPFPNDAGSSLTVPLESGADAGPADGASPDAQCDTTQDPSVEPCLVSETYGVFVSATGGTDSAPGTRGAPLKTIGEGIQKAVTALESGNSTQSRVFICQGTYDEQVTLDETSDGIGLYGGFECGCAADASCSATSWQYVGMPDAGPVVTVQAPGALYALLIDRTSLSIAIEDIAFSVPNAMSAADGGGSSIAAFVTTSGGSVSFARDVFIAGSGASAGNAGPPLTNWFSSNLDASAGNAPDGAAGGAQQTCLCAQSGQSTGGFGGNGGNPAGDGGAGSAVPEPAAQGIENGAGGIGFNSAANLCAPGAPGADGIAQSDGGTGASVFGFLSDSGWLPGPGSSGTPGNPGQGGGGGGGGQVAGSGGGACGGCGGAGGLAGAGGGASIALLVYESHVNIKQSAFVVAAAGNGGGGGTGENGASGGAGSAAIAGECPGGNGGNGAGGQGGGGGAGGVSIGILYSTSFTPTLETAPSFTGVDAAAAGGAGGAGGHSAGATDASLGPPGTGGTSGGTSIPMQAF